MVGGGDRVDKRETQTVAGSGHTVAAAGEGFFELVQLFRSELRPALNTSMTASPGSLENLS